MVRRSKAPRHKKKPTEAENLYVVSLISLIIAGLNLLSAILDFLTR